MAWDLVVGFTFGVVIATLTAPVGVSGAVFLLPVQISVLPVPSPSVTPTNLLYNVVASSRAGRSSRCSSRCSSCPCGSGCLVGGIYGIGGGSLLAPVLAASGYLLAEVAPVALMSTCVTSCLGAATYGVLAPTGRRGAGPHRALGIAWGLGGLVGGYLGASLQPRMPQRALRLLLGALAIALSVPYLVEAART